VTALRAPGKATMAHLYALDIETDTSDGRAPRDPDYPAGLDPRIDPVISVAVWDRDAGTAAYWSADTVPGAEKGLLVELDRFLATRPCGVIVTWNGANFDLPYLATRYDRLGVATELRLTATDSRPPKYAPVPGGSPGGYHATWARHQHLDVAFAYAPVADELGVRWSLKPVAEALGIDMISVERDQMEALSESELRDYNVSDVRGTAELAARLSDEDFHLWLDPTA
jgi:DNA polymerase elongation subunit (family B)